MNYIVKDRLGQQYIVDADSYDLVPCDGEGSIVIVQFIGGPNVDADNVAATFFDPSAIYPQRVDTNV